MQEKGGDFFEDQNNVQLEAILSAFCILRRVKEGFAAKGWFPATSGNLSVRVSSPFLGTEQTWIAVTSSGKDKEMHTIEDFLVVDGQGLPVFNTKMKPSAETLVHTSIYSKIPDSQAVFHIHTVANNLISELYRSEGEIIFSNHEMLKALGIWEGGVPLCIPIVDNYEHIPTLAAEVSKVLNSHVPGVLIHNHGIYVWGTSDFTAKRHVEALEFLFDYHLKSLLFESFKTMKKGVT